MYDKNVSEFCNNKQDLTYKKQSTSFLHFDAGCKGFKSVRASDLNKKKQLGFILKVFPECALFILLFLINFSSPDCSHQYNI